MRQKIQRLLLFSVGMSSLVLVSEPMIPSILPALAAAGQDTGTIHQNNSHEKSQHPGQFDGKVIAQKNELTRATAPSHRLIGRTPSPQSLVEINNDASLHPSLSTSTVASFGADDSQPRGISSQFSGPSTATPSSQLGGILGSGFGATSTVPPTSSLLGVTAQTSQAVAAPQASPMQTQPSSTPLRRLMSEIPGLKQLVAPSITILPPPSLKPAIGVSSPSFSFSLQQGDGSPTTQTLTVTNIGGGTLDWNAVSTAAWLNPSPASGKDAGTIALTATTGSLAAGTYTALVTVSAPNATPVSLPVTFTVTAPSPTLTVNPTAVTFSGVQGGTNPASQSIAVTSNGNWTASSSVPWLTLSPSSGNGNGSLAANVTLASAAVGPNQATITVTSGGVTKTAAVTFTVAAATLTAAPNSLTYTATQGGANPAAQTITVSANGTWTVSEKASWLSLSRASGSNNGTITASVNTATATQGPNSTTITVTSGGITRTVNITLTLNAPLTSSVTLTWRPNTESDLAGYKVYRANSSGAYGAPIAAIPGNTASYTVTGLQFNTTYYFVVTAYDIAGNESAYSNEVSKSIF
jgi:Fibronectin type III domain/Viral BACON domain